MASVYKLAKWKLIMKFLFENGVPVPIGKPLMILKTINGQFFKMAIKSVHVWSSKTVTDVFDVNNWLAIFNAYFWNDSKDKQTILAATFGL